MRHLAELGHTRILHLAGASRAPDALERVRGWRDELAARRLETVEPVFGDWSAASGHRIGGELDIEPGTAIFVATTTWRSGCSRRCASAVCACPRTSASSASTTCPRPPTSIPPLTTVRQDFAALGELIMQKVLIAVEEPDSVTEDTPLPTHLIVRQSTGAPRKSSVTSAE